MNYAFIDSQNLNLAIKNLGWKLDFEKFRTYLKDRYKVKRAYLFIGYVPGNENFYTRLEEMGYVLVFRPTLQHKDGATIKGNCDAELVLHCMIQYRNFDKAVIVSGDGDFHCLIEYLEENEKLLRVGIPDKRKYSALLRKFRPSFFYICDLKEKLEYKKRGRE